MKDNILLPATYDCMFKALMLKPELSEFLKELIHIITDIPIEALKDINIDIKENKVTALIGPSGCGKSTFLRTLNRMNDLIENVTIKGKIEVDGEDIYQTEDVIKLRTKVGMVFQHHGFQCSADIEDNCGCGHEHHHHHDCDCGHQHHHH